MRNVKKPAKSLRSANVAFILTAPGFLALVATTMATAYSRPNLSQGPGVSNHPVNVIPSSAIRIPLGWPLGPDGSITCRTCHTTLPALNSNGDAKLRGSKAENRAFCANCHSDGRVPTASMHWMAVPRAHVHEHGYRNVGGGSIDRPSAECLSCHDGVTAGETGYGSGIHGGDYGDPRRNHPIGVRYPRQGTTRTEVPLRPANALPPTIHLPGGTVSCISCHDLYNMESKRLSVPIIGSQLCFTCHNMN